MKPFGDGFIKLIKMIIAPVIFCTVVTGIAGMEDMKKVGKTGGLAILYFEVVSTIALIVGLVLVNTFGPGRGMHVDPATLDAGSVAIYTSGDKMESYSPILNEHHPQHGGECLCRRQYPSGSLFPRFSSVLLYINSADEAP